MTLDPGPWALRPCCLCSLPRGVAASHCICAENKGRSWTDEVGWPQPLDTCPVNKMDIIVGKDGLVS